MNNDACLTEGNILQPEVVEEAGGGNNLVTIMVLSRALAHSVLGKDTPKGGKLEAKQGQKVVKTIETAIRHHFPETSPMILSLFGLEMIGLMPSLKNPDILVKKLVSDFVQKTANAAPSPQSYMD